LDGRHKQILNPKQVVQAHCNDLGIPWQVEYAKYESAMADRKAVEKQAQAQEREARGQAEGEKRKEMIAKSRERFGELNGPLVLAFPGWKCRWDFLPDSGQTPKTFIAPDGREWKLLKDLECMFGTRLTQGGKEAEAIMKMIDAGNANIAAQALFSEGSRRCKESQGSVEIDPATEEIQVESREEFQQKREHRAKKKKSSNPNRHLLWGVRSEVYPVQEGWAALLEDQKDLQSGFAKFRELLKKKGFAGDVELIAIHGVQDTCRFAARVSGIYYRMPSLLNERPCYQKLLNAPELFAGLCCDGIYMMWDSVHAQWQISNESLGQNAPCFAYCKEDKMQVVEVSGPWQIQRQGTADFQESTLKIMLAAGEK